MKLTYFLLTTSVLLLVSANAIAQQSAVVKPQDTIRKNNSYGLRVGLDLQNIVTSFTNSDFQGIEFMGDYRLSDKYYFAAELGNQKKTVRETSVSTTASGNYLKAGVDINAYKNLVGLRNLIFIGARYGYALYSQELNSYSIATQNNFFGVDSRTGGIKEDNLSAHWLELLAGIKAEVLNNVFIGFSISIQRKLFDKQPDDFDSLYIPGFGTTNDFGEISAGYRYFVEYYIPLYKKKKKIKKEKIESDPEKEIGS